MKCKEIIKTLEELAPVSLAESWDNVGLLIGDEGQDITNIMITLDITSEVVKEAIAKKTDLIIAHHPIIFSPIRKIVADDVIGQMILNLIRHNIAVYAAHTNLDIARGGLNDILASKLNLKELDISEEDNSIGRIGYLNKPMPLREFLSLIKSALPAQHLIYTGDKAKIVQKVAICTGSGGEYIQSFSQRGADVYVTGEVKYHEALIAKELGLSLVAAGHFETENIIVSFLMDYISSVFEDSELNIYPSEDSKGVFKII